MEVVVVAELDEEAILNEKSCGTDNPPPARGRPSPPRDRPTRPDRRSDGRTWTDGTARRERTERRTEPSAAHARRRAVGETLLFCYYYSYRVVETTNMRRCVCRVSVRRSRVPPVGRFSFPSLLLFVHLRNRPPGQRTVRNSVTDGRRQTVPQIQHDSTATDGNLSA